jgi:hypothetical protein
MLELGAGGHPGHVRAKFRSRNRGVRFRIPCFSLSPVPSVPSVFWRMHRGSR